MPLTPQHAIENLVQEEKNHAINIRHVSSSAQNRGYVIRESGLKSVYNVSHLTVLNVEQLVDSGRLLPTYSIKGAFVHWFTYMYRLYRLSKAPRYSARLLQPHRQVRSSAFFFRKKKMGPYVPTPWYELCCHSDLHAYTAGLRIVSK